MLLLHPEIKGKVGSLIIYSVVVYIRMSKNIIILYYYNRTHNNIISYVVLKVFYHEKYKENE